MRALVAGAGGLIGSVVARDLVTHGSEVVRLVRHDPDVDEVQWDPDAGTIDRDGLEGFDAVVDVASMPWPTRWTSAAKRRIYDNRVRSYRLLAEALAGRAAQAAGPRLRVGHGDLSVVRRRAVLTEASAIGSDFLAGLQRDGEAATAAASAAGIRVVHLRIPSVIGGPNLPP